MEHQQTARAEPRASRAPDRAGATAGDAAAAHPVLALQARVGNQAAARFVQAKLRVGPPGDAYEQEADRVADAVMRMPEGGAIRPVQRQPIHALQPKCAQCEKEEQEGAALQRDEAGAGAGPGLAPPVVHDVLASAGEPLEAGTRVWMEARLGADFGGVRVHTGARAADSARAVNANAYTVGRDVVFAAGRYAPGTREGTRLIAHELTHVLQQAGTAAPTSRRTADVRLQRDGPVSSPAAHAAFSEAQRNFLQGVGINPAELDPAVAQRMASLLGIAQQASQGFQTGGGPGMSGSPGAAVTIDKKIGPSGADISMMIVSGGASMIVSRHLDLATGSLTLQFAYQDTAGNRIEVQSTSSGTPTILNQMSLEMGPTPMLDGPGALSLPQVSGVPTPDSGVDDFSDLLPSETPEAESSEGISSFLEGAIVGDFGENSSWSAIAGQTVVGFIPIVGQIADVRDLSAAFNAVSEGREGAWLNVAIAGVAFIPGLDFLKGGTRVGRRALQEAASESITSVSESALRRARRVLSREAVQIARQRLRALATGRIELLQRLAELSAEPAIRSRTSDLVQRARNALRDHLTPQDLSGALRDRLGMPVRVPGSGAALDHWGEVQAALSSLTDARRALLGEMQRLTPGSDAFRRVSRDVDALTEMRRRILEFLETR